MYDFTRYREILELSENFFSLNNENIKVIVHIIGIFFVFHCVTFFVIILVYIQVGIFILDVFLVFLEDSLRFL